jgi:hypothetical protein
LARADRRRYASFHTPNLGQHGGIMVLSRVVVAVVLVMASAVSAPVALGAAERPVALGEISSEVFRRDVDMRALLRSTSEQELGALDLSRVSMKKRAILSVALVRMDSTVAAAGKSTTCVVSATLRDARRGAIFAILEGKARAQGDPSSASPTMERSALEAAVRGAIARIPEALKR